MPKIDEITCDSDINSFINYNDIHTLVEETRGNINQIDTNILTPIRNEMEKGGFDLYSVNINGVPVFHDRLAEIFQKISVSCTSCIEAIDAIDDAAKKHRIDELTKYIEMLNSKVTSLDSEFDQLIEQQKTVAASGDVSTASANSARLQELGLELGKYQSRRDTAQTELENYSK